MCQTRRIAEEVVAIFNHLNPLEYTVLIEEPINYA